MDATASALLKEAINSLELIVANLEPLKSLRQRLLLQPDFIGAFIGALLSSAAALTIALRQDEWRRRKRKSDIKALEVVGVYQNSIRYYRLVLRNEGKYTARNIEVDVEEVYDEGGKERDNFIPAPLRWTHINTTTRNIFPNQVAYLDICEFKQEQGRSFIRLFAPNIKNLNDMPYLGAGQTKLVLRHYQENGQTGEIEVFVNWSGREEDLPSLKLASTT